MKFEDVYEGIYYVVYNDGMDDNQCIANVYGTRPFLDVMLWVIGGTLKMGSVIKCVCVNDLTFIKRLNTEVE